MAWCGAALLIAYFHESFARRFFFSFVRSIIRLFVSSFPFSFSSQIRSNAASFISSKRKKCA